MHMMFGVETSDKTKFGKTNSPQFERFKSQTEKGWTRNLFLKTTTKKKKNSLFKFHRYIRKSRPNIFIIKVYNGFHNYYIYRYL